MKNMKTSQLELDVLEQIKSEIEIDFGGKGKASVRATARLAGVDDEAIRKVLSHAADLSSSKLAQSLIAQGFTCADLNE